MHFLLFVCFFLVVVVVVVVDVVVLYSLEKESGWFLMVLTHISRLHV